MALVKREFVPQPDKVGGGRFHRDALRRQFSGPDLGAQDDFGLCRSVAPVRRAAALAGCGGALDGPPAPKSRASCGPS
jgi:hypothetical protein